MRRFIAYGVAAFLLVGLAGFAGFLKNLPKSRAIETMPRADAIVVLTGAGGVRIDAAAQLLEQNRGQRLLISGVHNAVQRAEIQELFHLNAETMACCIDLGYRARNTLGNAGEIANWAKNHDYHHLIVVTSTYHMPRALIELQASLPHAELVPFAVEARRHKGLEKWRRISVEYLKYAIILAREALLGLEEKPGAAEN